MEASREQRSAKRRPLKLVAWVLGETWDGEVFFESGDVSRGGMFLRSDFLLEIGTPLELWFSAPGASEKLVVSARVAWIEARPEAEKGPGMGVEFLNLNDAGRRFLASLER